MNDLSSRSHLIFSLLIDSTDRETGKITYSKLSFVDLAGSESAKKSNVTDPKTLQQLRNINKSLAALKSVISTLSVDESKSNNSSSLNVKTNHIPYRDSKLTFLMKDSIGGNSKTLMIVNISPSDINEFETLSSLLHGSKAKTITNESHKNIETKEMFLMNEKFKEAVEKIDLLKKELHIKGATNDEIDRLINNEPDCKIIKEEEEEKENEEEENMNSEEEKF